MVVAVGGSDKLLDSWARVVNIGCFDWSIVIHEFDMGKGFA